jgi:adenosine 3'-phospho 5'-phosphosulfate transporter B3
MNYEHDAHASGATTQGVILRRTMSSNSMSSDGGTSSCVDVERGDVERGGGAGAGDGKDRELISPGSLKRLNVLRVWGREVKLSEGKLLATLASGALFAYLGFTTMQEGVFRHATKDFKYGGVVSLCTCSVYCLLAQAERFSNGDVGTRRGRLIDYAVLSMMTSGSMYLTNAALGYINYTTRIVAKCSKIIPTMIVGTFMHGRRYGLADYMACSLLVLGVTMFTMGDVDSFPSFNWRGITYIVIALFMESTAGNFEERRFFSLPQPISHCEVVFYVNAIGSLFLAFGLLMSGELFVALAHVLSEPLVLATICMAAAFGYISVTCILLCLRHYGATNTEVIKTLRKMFSLALSLIVYPKPMGWKYVCGTIATAVALFALYSIKMHRLRASGGSMEAAK